jgi:hypothetical protein
VTKAVLGTMHMCELGSKETHVCGCVHFVHDDCRQARVIRDGVVDKDRRAQAQNKRACGHREALACRVGVGALSS